MPAQTICFTPGSIASAAEILAILDVFPHCQPHVVMVEFIHNAHQWATEKIHIMYNWRFKRMLTKAKFHEKFAENSKVLERFWAQQGGMEWNERISRTESLDLLLRLKERFGSLNTALVALYVECHGESYLSAIAQDVGLSRGAVRRALQEVSLSDTK